MEQRESSYFAVSAFTLRTSKNAFVVNSKVIFIIPPEFKGQK
jgi:phosphatidylserine decarboxylase